MALSTDRKSPGLFGILFGVVLSLLLGAVLAVVSLIFKPVEVVQTMPKEPVEGVRYFVEGASGSSAGRSWERKAAMVEAGGVSASFSEAELNAWSEATFETAKVDEKAKQETAMIIAGKPNFRIAGTSLQLGLVNEFVVFGLDQKLVLQAKGGFVRKGNGWGFEASESYLGGLPLHKLPAIEAMVARRFRPATEMPAVVAKMLQDATSIGVGEDMLTVTLR